MVLAGRACLLEYFAVLIVGLVMLFVVVFGLREMLRLFLVVASPR